MDNCCNEYENVSLETDWTERSISHNKLLTDNDFGVPRSGCDDDSVLAVSNMVKPLPIPFGTTRPSREELTPLGSRKNREKVPVAAARIERHFKL